MKGTTVKTDPCTYVIFGATGNLSRIKLMPALYHLDIENRLDKDTKKISAISIATSKLAKSHTCSAE
jgi:glucose-6-phosphate 1-dehydrogenase